MSVVVSPFMLKVSLDTFFSIRIIIFYKNVFNLTVSNYCFLPRQNYPNEDTCIGYSQMFSANDSSMNGT